MPIYLFTCNCLLFPLFLAIQSEDVGAARALTGRTRVGHHDRSRADDGPAGPQPSHGGGAEDHPLRHGPAEEGGGERADHAEVSEVGEGG